MQIGKYYIQQRLVFLQTSSIALFDKIISQQCIDPDLRKVQALTDMPQSRSKKELQLFLDFWYY